MMFLQKHFIKFLLITLITLPILDCAKTQDDVVSKWAEDIGQKLHNLGQSITKSSKIEEKYKSLHVKVVKKDMKQLLSEVVTDIGHMMYRKMAAIMCIAQAAETAAELFEYDNETEYQYYSSKYSSVEGEEPLELPSSLEQNKKMYLTMTLDNDTHFYNLPVDTNRSSVHVPTNIYDRHDDAAFAIQWSEALNDVFVKNYNSDPALSWQYFGSSSGIMRHYPAKKWPDIETDEYDCRIRTWFIEAATCTKDLIILVDNSGSMEGIGKHIAAFTVNSILDTLSNNDYINVLYYNLTTNYTIPCFENILVQATPENICLFKSALGHLKPEGKTDLSQALDTSFKILRDYREKRGCNQTSMACNQAIMVITDGISRNLSDVVIKNNYLDAGSDIPVRIFTYLIGKEVSNVQEILWMACANRGYYTHVQKLEQVAVSVLQYINVIARPLVLQALRHPVSWTHAYKDVTYDDKNDDQINEPFRLLTSAAVPAFDTKVNKNNKTRVANLLGVAGTDVPIDDIQKLTVPYKIGVNGYAFVVSNNGYVLMHRDLRPVFQGILRKNFNSIDLTEVEQFDNDLPPRELDEVLLYLRDSLVSGLNDSLHDVSIKYHYDNMRRVIRKKYDFFYAPLRRTPFSLAFAIPDGYGHYSLNVKDEIEENRHTGAKITEFFKGSNWKVHPKWVYCKYHYLENHEFKTPELEIIHFLDKVYDPKGFIWEKQYEAKDNKDETDDEDDVKCSTVKTHENDDYYCDRELVQRLVFDVKNTLQAFVDRSPIQPEHVNLFNPILRFIATMSGFTHWEYFNKTIENGTKKEFGDYHSRAIDETWYKSAVIQHEYDPQSFVYSVPFPSNINQDLAVTVSYAVFRRDEDVEAPACVVGFQFPHKNLVEAFQNISDTSEQCPDCETCNTTLECYLIDNNGYIVVSRNTEQTGLFFGEIEGDVMDSMLMLNIFEKVTLYDYQAICDNSDDKTSDGYTLLTPLHHLQFFFNWFIMKIAWLAVEMNIYNLWVPFYTFALENFNTTSNSTESDDIEDEIDEEEEEDIENRFFACETQRDIFILQQENFFNESYLKELKNTSIFSYNFDFRPYYIKKIPYSNLYFVAVNTTVPRFNQIQYSTMPQTIAHANDTEYPCQKLKLNNLKRRRLTGCYNENPLENEIKACGKSATIKIGAAIILTSLLLLRGQSLYILLI